jgi:short-subunit dehydrogenase
MPVIAIIGSGPGLGAAVARRFGREGFAVALISRDQLKLDALAAELGPVTTVQYSPLPSRDYLKPVLDLTPELALEALQFSALGLIHSVRTVLPAMREAGHGSIILINGGTSVKARAGFAGTSLAFPAESAYGEMLYEALEGEGIRVRQLVIPGGIPKLQLPHGIDDVASRLWEIHTAAGPFRTMLIPLEDGKE